MSSIHKLKWEVVNIRQLLSKVKYLKGQLRKLTKKKMLNILNIYITIQFQYIFNYGSLELAQETQ